jgi:hypothetical protein
MVRSVYLRGLAIVYAIAFASLLPQFVGLVGAQGILPATQFLNEVRSQFDGIPFFSVPTLAWINSSDGFLLAIVWAGIALSLAVFFRILPLPSLVGLYILYLSVDTVGQTFLSFQWDALLLETGVAAILLAPVGFRPRYTDPPLKMAIWVQRFILFRLMLESGLVKLLSGDPTWRGFTALTYHYETQPLPTPLAWYAHQLPLLFQKASVLGVFAFELIVPFLFLATHRLRMVGACLTILFQLMIAASGNYTFFNLLTIVLCIPLLDDKYLRWLGSITEPDERTLARTLWIRRWITTPAAVTLIAIGVLQLVTMLGVPRTLPEPLNSIDYRAQTAHIVNHYGLFAVMTTSRPEIVIEGSNDGSEWKAYEFKYKPGDVYRRLRWVAPYQPRLDWQMWFAALSNYQSNPWFSQLMVRLLEGSPAALNLLATNPFPDKPPQFLRAIAYDYHFSDPATRRATGARWVRRYREEYFPVVSLRQKAP